MAITLCLTVNLKHICKSSLLKFTINVEGSRLVLGEDDDLLPFHTLVLSQYAFQFTNLVIVARIDVHHVLDKLRQDFHVDNGVIQHGGNIKIRHIQIVFNIPNIVRKIVFHILNSCLDVVFDVTLNILDNIRLLEKETINRAMITLFTIINHELL